MPIVAEEPGDYLKGIFVHLRDATNLMDAVEEALYPTKEYSEKVLSYRDNYFTGLDGRAGERARDIIISKVG